MLVPVLRCFSNEGAHDLRPRVPRSDGVLLRREEPAVWFEHGGARVRTRPRLAAKCVATPPGAPICERAGCSQPLSLKPQRGSPRRFCSPACRRRAWDEANPRVRRPKPLDLAGCMRPRLVTAAPDGAPETPTIQDQVRAMIAPLGDDALVVLPKAWVVQLLETGWSGAIVDMQRSSVRCA